MFKKIVLACFIIGFRTHAYLDLTAPIEKLSDIVSMFALTPEKIAELTEHAVEQVHITINEISVVPTKQRTFANTVLPIDRSSNFSNAFVLFQVCQVLKDLHPDNMTREAAAQAIKTINSILSIPIIGPGELTSSQAVYEAFCEYMQGNGQHEKLTEEQHYYLQDLEMVFQRAGFGLPQEKRNRIARLRRNINELTVQFSKNIAQDKSVICATKQELAGVDDELLASIKQDEHGHYLVPTNGRPYTQVMRTCSIEKTRKQLLIKHCNRAYPANDLILQTIVSKRDELASILGYKSYADFDLATQMAETPEHVEQFFAKLTPKALKKHEREFKELTAQLPESVSLTSDGKIKPWDGSYLEQWFSKQRYTVNEGKIAEYFTLDTALEALFNLCKNMFGIHLERVSIQPLWQDDVIALRVSDQKKQIVGYVLLDLYHRDNKASYAGRCYNIVPSLVTDDTKTPALVVIMANWSKPIEDKPMLLRRKQVSGCIFHEFGHALHNIFGATTLARFAGMNVPFDFLEMPSQMLEVWADDINFMQKISKHYKTGQKLSDELVEQLRLKDRRIANSILHSAGFSALALALYKEGADKNPAALAHQINQTFWPNELSTKNLHGHACSEHLTIYGPRCYCYKWSKVAACDIVAYIKKQLPVEPTIGKRYLQQILSRGGSKDPTDIMLEFLGREPNDEAFCKAVGL